MNIKRIIFGLLSLSLFVNPYLAYADEISVSGNAEGSSNNVNISQSNNNTTTQENKAEINNNVEVNANTGNNTANENTGGEVNIATGDISVDSTIVNAGINQSYVENDCCQANVSGVISGNGADSTNSINYSVNNNRKETSSNISVNNTANITNNVNGTANTGYNQANNNNGNVSIATGSITVKDTIKNKSINIYEVEAPTGNGGDVSLSIKDNGSGSINSITLVNDSDLNIDINNNANITNNSFWDLNTGGNEANGNNGDVDIKTGDILLTTSIENKDINVGLVDVECCEEDKGGPGPDDNPPPPTTTTKPIDNNGHKNDDGKNGGNGGTGSVLGAILPVTGDYFMLLMMIGNVMLFFLGGYLRLRSGRSPNYLFAR